MKVKVTTKADSGTSFSQKFDSGWTKEQLMKYYAMTEKQYEKVMACLSVIRNERQKVGKAVV